VTPHDLLANFETLAEAPNGIQRLRELVLELAVRGKLVEQDPRDEPASDLFIRIKSIKSKMAAKGDSKAIKSYPLLTDRDCPSKLPNTWTWCRLGEIVEVLDYKRIPINAEERSARIAGKSRDALFPYFGATQQQGLIDDYLFDDDLVLLGEDGAPFLDRSKSKAYSVSGKCWVNNHAHVIKGIETETKYLQHVLNTVDYAPYVTGTTRLKLNQAQMVLIPIPLPPLAEQRRIVARVDELMAHLDRLEAKRQEWEAALAAARDSALAALREAPTPDEVETAWLRIQERFHELFATPEDVEPLRALVLELAVHGKLVEQDSDEEPAEALMASLRKEKAKLVREGRIRADRALAESKREDCPFAVPKGWAVCRMTDLGFFLGGKTPSTNVGAYWDGAIPWVSPKDMKVMAPSQ